MQHSLVPIEQFIKSTVHGPLSDVFSKWLKRIMRISLRETDTVCEDMESIITDKPDNAINRVLSAFLFALYRDGAIDCSLPFAHTLYLSSFELCSAIDLCMHCPNNVLRDTGATAIRAMGNFLSVHREWRQANEQTILRRLTHGTIERMHAILVRCDQVHMAQNTLATNPTSQGSVLATMKLASRRATCRINSVLPDSSAVRMMYRMADSEFWGSQRLHTSWFMHEVMIDQHFRLAINQTIPNLSAKYSNRRVWNAGELIFDAGTVIMWKCSKAEDIIQLAEAVDIDLFPALLHNIPATVERIRCIVCRVVPGFISAELGNGYSGRDDRQSLHCLLQYALILRNTIANIELDAIRQRQFSDMADYMHHLDFCRVEGIKTREWIHAAVMRNGQAVITNLLAKGDPFALLKLHDHAIMDIVLMNNNSITLNIDALPEILYHDLNRLQYVFSTLHSFIAIGSNPSRGFNAAFRELVNTGTRKHRLSAHVEDAAAKLRTIIFVCRYRHGNAVAKTAHEIAKSVAKSHGC